MKGLFVSEQFIKDTTPINDNIDMKLIKNAIIEAQEINLLEKIGSGLYNDLTSKIASGTTLTADEVTLIEVYIRPALKYWVLVEGLPMMLFKLTNKSISTSTSDNSQPVQYEDMRFLINNSKSKAELYTERLVRYLQANESKYPLYRNAGNTSDTIYPESTQFTTDWLL